MRAITGSGAKRAGDTGQSGHWSERSASWSFRSADRIKLSAPTLGLHWQTHTAKAFEAGAAMATDTGERVHVELK